MGADPLPPTRAAVQTGRGYPSTKGSTVALRSPDGLLMPRDKGSRIGSHPQGARVMEPFRAVVK